MVEKGSTYAPRSLIQSYYCSHLILWQIDTPNWHSQQHAAPELGNKLFRDVIEQKTLTNLLIKSLLKTRMFKRRLKKFWYEYFNAFLIDLD